MNILDANEFEDRVLIRDLHMTKTLKAWVGNQLILRAIQYIKHKYGKEFEKIDENAFNDIKSVIRTETDNLIDVVRVSLEDVINESLGLSQLDFEIDDAIGELYPVINPEIDTDLKPDFRPDLEFTGENTVDDGMYKCFNCGERTSIAFETIDGDMCEICYDNRKSSLNLQPKKPETPEKENKYNPKKVWGDEWSIFNE